MSFQSFIHNLTLIVTEYWKLFIFEGVFTTIKLTAIAVFFGALLGVFIAFGRMTSFKPLKFIASVYVEILRGTPILLQLYVFTFVLPQVFPFLNLSKFMWVAIALCVNSSAYVSEVYRSGIQAVDKGQSEAARSLGLSHGQTMLHVVLPQAIRNILPALSNEFIMMLKETSLASTFYLGDLMTSYLKVKGATFISFETLFVIGVLYLCMTYPLSKAVEAFERRMANGK